MKNAALKYNIHYLLRQLTVNDYEIAMKQIPMLVGVSERTFRRWIYLKTDSFYDLPFCSQIKIANYFEVKPFEVFSKEMQEELKELANYY